MDSGGEAEHLIELEWSLWRPETRFDREYLEQVLAADVREFGRSGRTYDRQAIIEAAPQAFDAELDGIEVTLLDEAAAVLTYQSTYSSGGGDAERANRSSVWRRTPDSGVGWQLVFHQGTPIEID